MRAPCVSAATLAALALCACAELRWEKAGADAETAAQDMDACRTQARASVARSAPIAPPITVDPKLGVVGPQPSATTPAIQEQEAADRCMRAKGYHLVPVQK